MPGLAAGPVLADERSCAPSSVAGAVTNGAILSGGAGAEPVDGDPVDADADVGWALAALAGAEHRGITGGCCLLDR